WAASSTSMRPRSEQSSDSRPRSAAMPYRWTAMTAFVRGPIAASVAAGSRANEQGSRSTNTGTAPVATTAFADAMNVSAGTMTSSPGPTPAAPTAHPAQRPGRYAGDQREGRHVPRHDRPGGDEGPPSDPQPGADDRSGADGSSVLHGGTLQVPVRKRLAAAIRVDRAGVAVVREDGARADEHAGSEGRSLEDLGLVLDLAVRPDRYPGPHVGAAADAGPITQAGAAP